jgi:hypothetical protein
MCYAMMYQAKSNYTTESEKEYNPSSIMIDFADFMSLLSNISTKVRMKRDHDLPAFY